MRNSSKRRPSQIAELLRSGGGVRAVKHILCAALFAAAAVAQSSTGYRIDTFAGSRDLRDNGPAPAAWLRSPNGVALDGAGNLFIADTDNHRIRKVDSAGVITTVAGTGRFGLGGNFGDGGPATAARLRSPEGVALDGAGNLFIADTDNHRIRKVDSAGVITTVAGTGRFGLGGNFGDGGPAIQAAVFYPSDVAVDGAGNLFIAERFYNQIRKVDSAGVITTVAGTGEFFGGFSGDGGPAIQAALNSPRGVALDGAGNLFIADTGNHRIRKVDSAGVISTVAGTGESFGRFSGDGGPAIQAALNSPRGVALDGAGNFFIADTDNHRIRKVDSAGVISTVVGAGEFGFAEAGGFGGDGGPAIQAALNYPSDVVADGAGNLYIADTGNHRIRKVDAAGVISTVAGSFLGGFGGDGGPAVEAQLNHPADVTTDGAGNLYIADTDNQRIRKVDAAGVISTVAGTGSFLGGFSGDGGPATAALLSSPEGVAVDGAGNLFIADRYNDRIRRWTLRGSSAPWPPLGGFSGDGGPATAALLSSPEGVAVDGAGNLFIADTDNHLVRKLTPVGSSTPPNPTAVLNAASFTPGAAPGSLQSLFGERLALETAAASELPLPEALGGVRIEIIDSTEAAHAAQLLYVSPGQINFLTPSEATPGAAVLRLTREGEEPVESALTISVAAPGLFSANGTGEGIGAITALRVVADGSRSTPAVFRFEAGGGRVVGVPLDLGDEGDRVFLTLFGTGIRGAGGATGVQTMIGDREVPVLFAGAQSGFAGLDQVNIGPLPRSLAGAGEINVVVTAAGTTSNTVTIVME